MATDEAAGAWVYATGRSSRTAGRSEIDRPETIEKTGELITAARGAGAALRVDHLDSGQVRDLVLRIDRTAADLARCPHDEGATSALNS